MNCLTSKNDKKNDMVWQKNVIEKKMDWVWINMDKQWKRNHFLVFWPVFASFDLFWPQHIRKLPDEPWNRNYALISNYFSKLINIKKNHKKLILLNTKSSMSCPVSHNALRYIVITCETFFISVNDVTLTDNKPVINQWYQFSK